MPQIPSGFGQNRGILFFAEDNLKAQTQLIQAEVELIKAKTERIKLENEDVQKLERSKQAVEGASCASLRCLPNLTKCPRKGVPRNGNNCLLRRGFLWDEMLVVVTASLGFDPR